jgi:hypothetical protein
MQHIFKVYLFGVINVSEFIYTFGQTSDDLTKNKTKTSPFLDGGSTAQ